MSAIWLDQYDSLDIIGNGAFGIIRKVRRKSDGLIFARKELNFERMSERDRKQIVSEVNILKELHHDNIVRYHDRFVDRDAGVLYILMEYCGGGDLSTVIKQAGRHNRPIPEQTIWGYFMQILLALQHCHQPNGHGRSSSGTTLNGCVEIDGGERRPQILHRDLKPDNVFLDEENKVKLGDFGLSKALAQTSFANTYVGTPYYMSPELMQEKAYDSKSDIWSLGCLIYELCALKPPFHEAKTHSELSISIRNGRIPPLPRGYSQSLSALIKAMLNLNPAMRPSATQLLQHERLEFAFKVSETEKMLSTIMSHKANLVVRERDVAARESAVLEREKQVASLVAHKDNEIASLQQMVTSLQEPRREQYSQLQMETAVREAVARREEELRELVMKRENEVAEAMARREEEIMEAVRSREAEVFEAWSAREAEMQREIGEKIKEVEERVVWIQAKEEELKAEDARLETLRTHVEGEFARWEETVVKGRKEKKPLEEVKNLLAPLARIADETPVQRRKFMNLTPKLVSQKPLHPIPLATPIARQGKTDFMPSAMKGVILTTTGENLVTPTPGELAKLFNNSPKVGLNFAKIFDFEDGDEDDDNPGASSPVTIKEHQDASPPPSPSSRKMREFLKGRERSTSDVGTSNSTSLSTAIGPVSSAPPTRLRRPSIRTRTQLPPLQRVEALTSSISDPSIQPSSSPAQTQSLPLPHPHLNTQVSSVRTVVPPIRSHPSPEYDLGDEENLPSPFLKRHVDRATTMKATGSIRGLKKRPSSGYTLRAVAAANAAGKRASSIIFSSETQVDKPPSGVTAEAGVDARPSLASARKATEDARKALSRS